MIWTCIRGNKQELHIHLAYMYIEWQHENLIALKFFLRYSLFKVTGNCLSMCYMSYTLPN